MKALSGWGIKTVTLPSSLVRQATAAVEPFGLCGYLSAMAWWLSTYCNGTRFADSAALSESSSANLARPSPCATGIDSTEPLMPRKNTEGDSLTRTLTSRASNCSEAFFTNLGQVCAPGMMSDSAASIWQPLQMPRAKVSGLSKNSEKTLRSLSWNRIDFAQPSPAPRASP